MYLFVQIASIKFNASTFVREESEIDPDCALKPLYTTQDPLWVVVFLATAELACKTQYIQSITIPSFIEFNQSVSGINQSGSLYSQLINSFSIADKQTKPQPNLQREHVQQGCPEKGFFEKPLMSVTFLVDLGILKIIKKKLALQLISNVWRMSSISEEGPRVVCQTTGTTQGSENEILL